MPRSSLSKSILNGLGLALVMAGLASAQGPPPPRPQPPFDPGQGPNVGQMAGTMADEVRRLADDMSVDLAEHRAREHMIEDAQELAASLADFRREQRRMSDVYYMRQAYSGLQASWRHLRDAIVRSRESSPVIDRDIQRIDAVDAQIGAALGLPPTVDDFGQGQGGDAETYRHARGLAHRAEHLALVVHDEVARNPGLTPLVQDVDALANETDGWRDTLFGRRDLGIAARNLPQVCAATTRVEAFVTTRPVSRRVMDAWEGYRALEEYIHGDLNVPMHRVVAPAPVVVSPQPRPFPRVVTSPLPGLAQVLEEQITMYIQIFGPTAGGVPEGNKMLRDAQIMQAAAVAFRQDVEQGANPNVLAARFREVDIPAQRLARRVNRIADGRSGPNIRQVNAMAATCEQIHQALGMPAFGPFYPGR